MFSEKPILKRETITDLGLIAQGYFLKASFECPASVVAQGAHIARKIKDTGEEPQQLIDALITDDSRIQTIINAASVAHARNPRAATPSYRKACDIIDADFRMADTLKVLSRAQLEHLYGPIYKFYVSQKPNIFPEDSMNSAADAMLRARIVELFGKSKNPPEPFTIFLS